MKPRVACVIVLRDDGAALLQLRDDKPGLSYAGRWVIPGGHCEECETIEACAHRELREETGYESRQLHWLAPFVDDRHPELHQIMFWTPYDGQAVRCLEGQRLEFVPRGQAEVYAVPGFLIECWDLAIAAASQTPVQRC